MTYGYLQHISEDGFWGTQIALVYSFAVVIIKGHNLKDIVDAIDSEHCECLQQFDERRWPRPEDPKAPIIDSIAFHVETRAKAMDQARAEIDEVRRNPPAPAS